MELARARGLERGRVRARGREAAERGRWNAFAQRRASISSSMSNHKNDNAAASAAVAAAANVDAVAKDTDGGGERVCLGGVGGTSRNSGKFALLCTRITE